MLFQDDYGGSLVINLVMDLTVDMGIYINFDLHSYLLAIQKKVSTCTSSLYLHNYH